MNEGREHLGFKIFVVENQWPYSVESPERGARCQNREYAYVHVDSLGTQNELALSSKRKTLQHQTVAGLKLVGMTGFEWTLITE